jgi:hypothetical protein
MKMKAVLWPNGVLLMAVLLIGVLAASWSMRRADRHMRDSLMGKLRFVQNMSELDEIGALSGSDADLASPVYQRLKRQLALACQTSGEYRFIYIMGHRADGSIIIHVDSEPADSKDYSPPRPGVRGGIRRPEKCVCLRCANCGGPDQGPLGHLGYSHSSPG